jgi:hypothetical protein
VASHYDILIRVDRNANFVFHFSGQVLSTTALEA